jgi:glycine hydroxymethyltransferase
MDRVAGLIADVLAATAPEAAASGGASKAKYRISEGVAERTKSACAELLAKFPLYPEVDLG